MGKICVLHDPRLLDPGAYPRAPIKRAIGLDLATNTGYAITHFRAGRPYEFDPGGWILGQATLEAGAWESGGLRFVKLRQLLEAADPDFIALELVRNTPNADFLKGNKISIAAVAARIMNTAQLLGAFMGTVAGWAEDHGIPCVAVPIGDIKKRATGRGNAGKPDIIAACNATFGINLPVDNHESTGADNVADAAFCLLTALEGYAGGVDETPRPGYHPTAAELEAS